MPTVTATHSRTNIPKRGQVKVAIASSLAQSIRSLLGSPKSFNHSIVSSSSSLATLNHLRAQLMTCRSDGLISIMLIQIWVSFITNSVMQKLNHYGWKHGILRSVIQIIYSFVWLFSSDLKPCSTNGFCSLCCSESPNIKRGNIFYYNIFSQLQLKSFERQSLLIRDFELKYMALDSPWHV